MSSSQRVIEEWFSILPREELDLMENKEKEDQTDSKVLEESQATQVRQD